MRGWMGCEAGVKRVWGVGVPGPGSGLLRPRRGACFAGWPVGPIGVGARGARQIINGCRWVLRRGRVSPFSSSVGRFSRPLQLVWAGLFAGPGTEAGWVGAAAGRWPSAGLAAPGFLGWDLAVFLVSVPGALVCLAAVLPRCGVPGRVGGAT